MLKNGWIASCLTLLACSAGKGNGSITQIDATIQGTGVDAAPAVPDAAAITRDASPPESSPQPPKDASVRPVPRVQLAPSFEDALACANESLPFDFEGTPGVFSVNQAFWMMWFTERAFFSEHDEIQSELRAIGFDQFMHVEDKNTGLQAYVAGSESAVIVAFRGSTELNDWLGDFNFPQDDGAMHGVAGRVHRGFAGALAPSVVRLHETVRAFAERGQRVWVTGHSLGGAEATLLAARLARDGLAMGPLYTFGAPRAGDFAFARDTHEKLSQRVYRIVNEQDIVARLPPAKVAASEAARVLPFGGAAAADLVRQLDYRHAGQMALFVRSDGTELTMMPVMSDDEDKPYWQDVGKGGTFGAVAGNRTQGERHAQQRYLCRLLALRRAYVPSFDRGSAKGNGGGSIAPVKARN